ATGEQAVERVRQEVAVDEPGPRGDKFRPRLVPREDRPVVEPDPGAADLGQYAPEACPGAFRHVDADDHVGVRDVFCVRLVTRVFGNASAFLGTARASCFLAIFCRASLGPPMPARPLP